MIHILQLLGTRGPVLHHSAEYQQREKRACLWCPNGPRVPSTILLIILRTHTASLGGVCDILVGQRGFNFTRSKSMGPRAQAVNIKFDIKYCMYLNRYPKF